MTATNNIPSGLVAGPLLNDEWENHGKDFDKVWDQIDKATRSIIQEALAKWQDYYYSDTAYDNWQISDLDRWRPILSTSKALLAKAIKTASAVPVAPKVTVPTKTITITKPLVVYGKVPQQPIPKPKPKPVEKKIVIDVDKPTIYDAKPKWGKAVAWFLGLLAAYKATQ